MILLSRYIFNLVSLLQVLLYCISSRREREHNWEVCEKEEGGREEVEEGEESGEELDASKLATLVLIGS